MVLEKADPSRVSFSISSARLGSNYLNSLVAASNWAGSNMVELRLCFVKHLDPLASLGLCFALAITFVRLMLARIDLLRGSTWEYRIEFSLWATEVILCCIPPPDGIMDFLMLATDP